jgi:hypothetical protein
MLEAEKEQWHPKLGKTCVMLAGLFTEKQGTIARQRTQVSFEKNKRALVWLKANNRLYAEQKSTKMTSNCQ